METTSSMGQMRPYSSQPFSMTRGSDLWGSNMMLLGVTSMTPPTTPCRRWAQDRITTGKKQPTTAALTNSCCHSADLWTTGSYITITCPLWGLEKQAEEMQHWVLCGEMDSSRRGHQSSLVLAELLPQYNCGGILGYTSMSRILRHRL